MDTEAEQRMERGHLPAPTGRPGWSRSVALRRARARRWWRGLSRWQEASLLALVCVALLSLVNAVLVQPFVIPSGSMENTLRVGDRVVVNKLAYRFGGSPHRGDVIVFDGTGSFAQDPPAENPVLALLRRAGGLVGLAQPAGTDYVKRVIGVGGDRVTCCDRQGRLSVNGHPVDEPYAATCQGDRCDLRTFTVPADHYFMMGDNRGDSSDSRFWGPVARDEMIGRAFATYWPVRRIGGL